MSLTAGLVLISVAAAAILSLVYLLASADVASNPKLAAEEFSSFHLMHL